MLRTGWPLSTLNPKPCEDFWLTGLCAYRLVPVLKVCCTRRWGFRTTGVRDTERGDSLGLLSDPSTGPHSDAPCPPKPETVHPKPLTCPLIPEIQSPEDFPMFKPDLHKLKGLGFRACISPKHFNHPDAGPSTSSEAWWAFKGQRVSLHEVVQGGQALVIRVWDRS